MSVDRSLALTSQAISDLASGDVDIKELVRKTGLVCTIGGNSDDVEIIKQLIRYGMRCARINLSFRDAQEHVATIARIKEAATEMGVRCALWVDTKNREIRTGSLSGGEPVQLVKGEDFVIDCCEVPFFGDQKRVHCSEKALIRLAPVDTIIRVNDGRIALKVKSVSGTALHCIIVAAAPLDENCIINVPATKDQLPILTQRDLEDLATVASWGVDIIAASFIRSGADIKAIREALPESLADVTLLAKICDAEGVNSIDDIIEAADGIVVSRGSLGVELPVQRITITQKKIVKKCNLAGKPVVISSQLLTSMVTNPRPTRAEATDVANCVLDGADSIMLSEETAAGIYPVRAVLMASRTCRAAELVEDHRAILRNHMDATPKPFSRVEAICASAVNMAHEMNASAIFCLTTTGTTARLASKYSPKVPIIAVTNKAATSKALWLSRGVLPVYAGDKKDSTNDELIGLALAEALRRELVDVGDQVILIQGIYSKLVRGSTNTLTVIEVPSNAAVTSPKLSPQ